MDLEDIARIVASMNPADQEQYWWSVLDDVLDDHASLLTVNEEGRGVEDKPPWALQLRQQIRDFSPCHYCFPFALELLLEGVGLQSPVESYRGCRSVSETRRKEASRQVAPLAEWLGSNGKAGSSAGTGKYDEDTRYREIFSTLGRRSVEKGRNLKKLLATLNRERKKGGGKEPVVLNGTKFKTPLRSPFVCDRTSDTAIPDDGMNGCLMENNPICHFKYFPYINYFLTTIGSDRRKSDVLSRRQIEREYKNRVQQIGQYMETLGNWLDEVSLSKAVQANGVNREMHRKIYTLLGESSSVKRWLVATIRATLDAYAVYFENRVIPIWEMNDTAKRDRSEDHTVEDPDPFDDHDSSADFEEVDFESDAALDDPREEY